MFRSGAYGKEDFIKLRRLAESKGIVFGQTHAPFGSAYPDEEKTKQRFEEIVESLRQSSYLGAPYAVVHPCQHIPYSPETRDELYEYNVNFYKKLIPYSEEYGVKIAIENINYKDKEGICSLPENLVKLYE